MRIKRKLSLMLVYVFILTILPMGLLAQRVNATSLPLSSYDKNGNLNYNGNYLAQDINVYRLENDNKSSLIIGQKSEDSPIEIIKHNPDGTSNRFDTELEDFRNYIGVASGNFYYLVRGTSNVSINSLNLTTGEVGKLCDVQVPTGFQLSLLGRVGKACKDGTIVLSCSTEPESFKTGKVCFIKITGNKQSILNVYEHGVLLADTLDTDSKGNLWITSVKESSLIKVDKNNNIIKYKIETSGYSLGSLQDIQIDYEDNIWSKVTDPELGATKPMYALLKVTENGNGVTSKIYSTDNGVGSVGTITKDSNGVIWIQNNVDLKKLENDSFIAKYRINYPRLWHLNVVDDNHFVVAHDWSYIYVNNGDLIAAPSINVEKLVYPMVNIIKNSDGTIIVTIQKNSIDKNVTNIIETGVSSDNIPVEIRVDMSSIIGGSGKLQFKTSGIDLALPIGAIDYNTLSEGDYLSFKQIINTNDPLATSIKAVNKVFNFDASIYNKDGGKVKDIHLFINDNKAQVILKLSAEDIAALNTGKLAVFYYNESTQSFENLAGSYDSTSNTFTFETTHLSKFVIGEMDSVGNVLPQFGTFIDTTVLIAIGLMMILGGGIVYLKSKIEISKKQNQN